MTIESEVQKGGGDFIALWPAEGCGPDLILFNDPETRSSLAINASTPLEQISEEVRCRIRDCREKQFFEREAEHQEPGESEE